MTVSTSSSHSFCFVLFWMKRKMIQRVRESSMCYWQQHQKQNQKHVVTFNGWLIVLWRKCFMNHTSHTRSILQISIESSWSYMKCHVHCVCRRERWALLLVILCVFKSACLNTNNKTWKKYQIQIWLLNTTLTQNLNVKWEWSEQHSTENIRKQKPN